MEGFLKDHTITTAEAKQKNWEHSANNLDNFKASRPNRFLTENEEYQFYYEQTKKELMEVKTWMDFAEFCKEIALFRKEAFQGDTADGWEKGLCQAADKRDGYYKDLVKYANP